jgi:hypothetical protein
MYIEHRSVKQCFYSQKDNSKVIQQWCIYIENDNSSGESRHRIHFPNEDTENAILWSHMTGSLLAVTTNALFPTILISYPSQFPTKPELNNN